MSSCGAVVGGRSLDGVDLSKQAVLQGVVERAAGDPVSGYVRLLDANDEFVAEVPLSNAGEFRFFATSGNWKLRVVTTGQTQTYETLAQLGEIVERNIILD
jgi:hypothetical protein